MIRRVPGCGWPGGATDFACRGGSGGDQAGAGPWVARRATEYRATGGSGGVTRPHPGRGSPAGRPKLRRAGRERLQSASSSMVAWPSIIWFERQQCLQECATDAYPDTTAGMGEIPPRRRHLLAVPSERPSIALRPDLVDQVEVPAANVVEALSTHADAAADVIAQGGHALSQHDQVRQCGDHPFRSGREAGLQTSDGSPFHPRAPQERPAPSNHQATSPPSTCACRG